MGKTAHPGETERRDEPVRNVVRPQDSGISAALRDIYIPAALPPDFQELLDRIR